MKKSLLAFLLFAAGGMPVYGDNCCAPCGPLNACEWSTSLRAGVEWMWYPERRRNDYVNCVAATAITIEGETVTEIDLFAIDQDDTYRTPRFTNQFTVPWTIVGEIGYAFTCNTEVFADFHYGRASGRSRTYSIEFDEFTLPGDPDVVLVPEEIWNISESYSDLKYFGGTIGMRHYFDPICSKFFPFFGVKAGVRHFDPVRATVIAQVFDDDELNDAQTEQGIYYDSYNVFHGGFQFGINMKCGDCINFFVMAEALATCGLKPHDSGFVFFNE